AYERVEVREPWLHDAVNLAQIGLFQLPGTAYFLQGGTDEGATRMLTQLKQQFDVVTSSSKLDKYDLLILPDGIPLDGDLTRRLNAYVKAGGALLASGMTGLNADGTEVSFGALGIKTEGMSPYATTFLRFGGEVDEDVPKTDHVNYERMARVVPAGKTKSLARVVEPYFDRNWRHFTSHNQTPGAKLSKYSAATLNGRVGYIAFPIFSAFANHGNYSYRLLVRNMLSLLLPDPLLRVDAPTGLEATVARQGKRTIVHLLFYSPERRAQNLDLVEDIVPLFNIPLSLKLDRAPKRVYTVPDETPVEFEFLNGRVNLRVPEIRGHQMIVLE
ncbi:MAG TPA: beta-galactosidase trimerization domain-containing protein, partial [Tepidisphaeraceae bacterium]